MVWLTWARRPEVNGKQLEAWLARVLVPVEPNPRFVGRLRARLVTYQGRKFPPVWFVVAVAASLLLVIASVTGHALRILIAIAAILAAGGRRRQEAAGEARPAKIEVKPG